jgi:hypothetical protein
VSGLPPLAYFQRRIQLVPKQVGYVGSYSRDMLRMEELPFQAFDQILLAFTTSILSGKTVTEKQRVTIRVPSSWWQQLKETAGIRHAAWLEKPSEPWRILMLPLDLLTIIPRACFVPWLLRRHPVKYTELTAEVRFTRDILYPGADISPLPPQPFGAPVWSETTEVVPDNLDGPPWRVDGYGPSRFLDRREIMHEIMRDTDLASGSWASPGADYRTVLAVLDWLGQHGVSVGQLVARSAA